MNETQKESGGSADGAIGRQSRTRLLQGEEFGTGKSRSIIPLEGEEWRAVAAEEKTIGIFFAMFTLILKETIK